MRVSESSDGETNAAVWPGGADSALSPPVLETVFSSAPRPGMLVIVDGEPPAGAATGCDGPRTVTVLIRAAAVPATPGYPPARSTSLSALPVAAETTAPSSENWNG